MSSAPIQPFHYTPIAYQETHPGIKTVRRILAACIASLTLAIPMIVLAAMAVELTGVLAVAWLIFTAGLFKAILTGN